MNNQLPDGWSSSIFANLFDIAIGGTPSRNEPLYWDASRTSGNNWVSIKDLKGKTILDTAEQITDLGIKKSNVKLVPKGTIMMSFKLSVGRVAFAGKNLYTNEAIAAFIPKDKMSIDLRYFYQGLQFWDLLGDIDQAVKGVTLNKEKIRNIEAILPPFPEQQKIAAILTSVDDVIEKTQAQINKLKDLKTGMMQELLTRGVGVDGKPHTEFKDSPVGRIPKDWGVVKLSSVLSKIDSGWSPSCIEVPPESGQWGVIKVSAVTRGSFLEIESKTLPDGLSPKPLIRIKKGDILLTRANGVADLVGKCVLVLDEPKANLMMSDKILRLNYSKAIHPYYLLYYFNSRTIRKQIELSWGGSSGQKNISQADIKNYLIALPSLEEQKIIGDAIFRVDQLWANKKEKLTKLEQLKKALMQDLLTGKVRVNVD